MSAPTAHTAATGLTVDGLQLTEGSAPFDLAFPAGKIIGISGLEGHGQQQLLEALCGLGAAVAGQAALDGEPLAHGVPRSLKEAFRLGIVYVPRDRKTEGIFPALSVRQNFAIATLSQDARLGVLNLRQERRRYEEYAELLGVVSAGPGAPIRSLSGGNQQKVLLARWLAARPRVLLLNDPSRGVDHRTRLSLHDLYRRVAGEGASVVLLSTEIEELLLAADEIIVFRERTVSGQLVGDERTRDRVLGAMFGAQQHA